MGNESYSGKKIPWAAMSVWVRVPLELRILIFIINILRILIFIINIYRKYIKKVSPKKEISLTGVRAASTGHPLRIRLVRKLDKQATKSLSLV